jgi:hypothetical protein
MGRWLEKWKAGARSIQSYTPIQRASAQTPSLTQDSPPPEYKSHPLALVSTTKTKPISDKKNVTHIQQAGVAAFLLCHHHLTGWSVHATFSNTVEH